MTKALWVAIGASFDMYNVGYSVVNGEALPDHLSVTSIATLADDGQGNTKHAITYSCSNGGEIEQTLKIIIGPFNRFEQKFSNCEWPVDEAATTTEILDGAVTYASGRRSDAITTLDNFKRVTDDAEVTVSGVHTKLYSVLSNYDGQLWEAASMQVQDAQWAL